MPKFNQSVAINRSTSRLSRLTLATRQGRLIVRASGIIIGLVCAFHLILGANPIVVLAAGLTLMLSIYPVALYGFLNLGAVLVALVGFRYVGFPLVAKLAMGQALDTFLTDPVGSFGVVLLGVLGYLGAIFWTSNRSVGKPIFQPVYSSTVLGRISFLAAVIGVTANIAVSFRIGEQDSGVTIAEFFVHFLHFALISGIARSIQASKMRRSVDAWVIVILIAEIAFAMVQNARMALMETLLCFIIVAVSFEGKINWRQFSVMVSAIWIMSIFVTPVFLHVRSYRNELSWTQRMDATIEAATNWKDTFACYMKWRDLSDRVGWYQSYYGSTQTVFERMSHINNVDILKAGSDKYGKVGAEDLRLSVERAIPRILAPNKPLGYAQGHWLYTNIGIYNPGPYPTAPLIGNGYVAFGWIGAFCYPFVLGLIWLLIIKKVFGWSLEGNVWAIYLLIRVHNQFVEGSSDSYVGYILRVFPQDLVLLWLVQVMAKGRFLHPWRRKAVQIYGK